MTLHIVNVPKRQSRALSYEVFERRYDPIEARDGSVLRHWDDFAVRDADPRQVWSVIDVDGALYVVAGLATVNYLGRLLTRRGWSDVEFSNPGYRY